MDPKNLCVFAETSLYPEFQKSFSSSTSTVPSLFMYSLSIALIIVSVVFPFLALSAVALFFVTVFQDHPISANWNMDGTTIDYPVLYIFMVALEVVYDLVVLCLPLPVISSLHLSHKRKRMIIGIFWLGGL